ncbi:MAG TPA: dihydrolipoamide acetyltransferase family protein [Anaerohalosphaeraceae bacterium]|nr:dihydrolipoamide acetyltransferase family protein [Anaerohalosphaeraceae bacterium]HPP56596.1 dihydrolipoamide acetyltransferase family protein [Anaerohalosphaeraceae bacterium]
MAIEILLPRLGRTMEQAVIVAVHVQVGQKVCKGQVLADIETDKAAMQIESPADGTIGAVLVEPPVTLPVDTPLFVLTEDGRPINPERLEKLKQQVQTARERILEPAAPLAHSVSPADLLRIPETPSLIRPQEAVEAFQTSGAVAPAQFKPGKKVPFTRWQAVVAQRMLLSKRQIPCFYLNLQADVTELTQLRDTFKKQGNNLSYNDFLLKAAAVSLRRYPILTGRLGTDTIELAPQIDIGLAVASEQGVVAPVLRAVDTLSLSQISAAVEDLVTRARRNALRPEDLDGGSMTISNLGGYGIDSFIPIVIPGQTSILGVGRIREQCVPDGSQIQIRKRMTLTLSVDHRIVNGAEAAQFLDHIKKMLEHPQELLDNP